MAPDSASNEAESFTMDYRQQRSLAMGLAQSLMKLFRPRLIKIKGSSAPGSQRLTPPPKPLRKHEVHERSVEDVWVYDIKFAGGAVDQSADSRDTADASQVRRIYYFAGGGWQMPPSVHHWALIAVIAQRVPNSIVSLVSYPLAPQNPASESMPRLRKLYRALMEESAQQGERVIFAGDSAGGNVVLSLVLWCLEANGEDDAAVPNVPKAIMAISPSTDLRHEDTSIKAFAKRDPILTPSAIKSTAAAWCKGGAFSPGGASQGGASQGGASQGGASQGGASQGGASQGGASQGVASQGGASQGGASQGGAWTAADGRVSPILGPMEQFAKHQISIHGVIGTADVLSPEAMVFMEKCRELGVRGKWLVWEKQMHCFPLAFTYGLRECVESVDWIVRVLSDA